MEVLTQNSAFISMPKAVEQVCLAIQTCLAPAESAKPVEGSAQVCPFYETVRGTDAGAKFFFMEAKGSQIQPLQARHKETLRRLQRLTIYRIL